MCIVFTLKLDELKKIGLMCSILYRTIMAATSSSSQNSSSSGNIYLTSLSQTTTATRKVKVPIISHNINRPSKRHRATNDDHDGKKERRREEIVHRKGIPQTQSFNDRMHPRNIYKDNPPDFLQLKEQFSEFAPYVIQEETKSGKPKARIEWGNREAVKCLTRILLKRDFGVEWTIPEQNLVPPVPSRLNYIMWIDDLVNSYTDLILKEKQDQDRICGIDVGAGASCIYPLLGTTLKGWNFIATESDKASVDHAHTIVSQNGLSGKIGLMHTRSDDFLRPALQHSDSPLDFTMCNPPFFDEDIYASANPETDYGGSCSETTYPGGEDVFVNGLINDSANFKYSVFWFTTMVGKKATLDTLSAALRGQDAQTIRTTKFFQGRTLRWAIAWSYYPQSFFWPSTEDNCACPRKKPALSEKFCVCNCESVDAVINRHKEAISGLSGIFVLSIYTESSSKVFSIWGIGAEKDSVASTSSLGQDWTCVSDSFSFCIDVGLPTEVDVADTHFEIKIACINGSGFARKSFVKLRDKYKADMQRTNRSWRRKLARQGKTDSKTPEKMV
eukprot:gb/GECG01006300.1/.p1 GENE.gb/GECG01006300.1/~~gb/GECG01006300.1/.p1  ORF type:complete len:559 (+),score=55.58 gb/GECG01006300.1/:1-1677(+)